MNIVALAAWLLTVAGGLILLMIWIMEYDREFQNAAATRLPVPVISAHALLGMSGLILWLSHIPVDEDQPFGAAADAGAQGADKDLTGCRPRVGNSLISTQRGAV